MEMISWPQFIGGLVWGGLAVLTIALLVLMRSRWGQSRPLRKCVVLSLWAHVLMATYAMTVPIVVSSGHGEDEPVVKFSLVEGQTPESLDEPRREPSRPWEQFSSDMPAPVDPELAPLETKPEVARAANPDALELPAAAPVDDLHDTAAPTPTPQAISTGAASHADAPALTAHEIDAPTATRNESPEIELPAQPAPRPLSPETDAIARSEKSPGERDVLAPPEMEPPSPRLSEAPSTRKPTASIADLVDIPTRGTNPADAARSDASTTNTLQQTDGASDVASAEASSHGGDSQERANENTSNRAGGGRPPALYRLRTAPNRAQWAESRGASAETEAAVEAALAWLAAHQSADGRWDSSDFGGGAELRVDGRDRQAAGGEADSGVTALAVLAFLGAGHTHEQGAYRQHVSRGLEFLRRGQTPDGSLAGRADMFAAMYSHGMATLAVGEAYAMTRDETLAPTLRAAIGYTLAAQHEATGGWRYRPGDLGDTSQFGWQLMALKSAELGGVEIPLAAHDGMVRYLKSVASGAHGGLAAYRPGELPSHAMTAEALACRQFLGMTRDNPASGEAGDYLLAQLPGAGKANFYGWYYATMAMFQLEGDHWSRWNDALKKELVTTQVSQGRHAGSWQPTTVWGGYGGRVYTTALGALCLEVYYRYLPLHGEMAAADAPTRR